MIWHVTSRRGVRALLLLGAACLGPTPARADWEEQWYNRKPEAGDLVLPLPCGAAMVFRPVDVPVAAGLFSDRQVTLGQAETAMGYNEYQRAAYLSAPFDVQGGGRRYWMGKYHVTRDQYAALRAQPCVVPTPAGRAPQAGVSWPEAVAWAAEWSAWLAANARDKLPRRGEALAFARLPTEDEWEYAARGGTKVSESEFLGRTFPMREGIERYAMAGTRVAAGRAQQVGTLLPNPLGLYDVLGNVDQMMLEPYRLNRVGRPHGAAGGLVVRGGNYSSTPASLHVAQRVEIPPVNSVRNEPTRLPTMGFRLVLSATSVGGLPETEQVRVSFEAESRRREEAVNDPRRALALLREGAQDDSLRAGLDRVTATLAAEERDRMDQARTALGAQMEAASVLAQNMWSLENTAKLQEQLADDFFKGEDARRVRAGAAQRRQEQASALEGYMRLLRQAASSPVRDELPARADVVRQELRARNQANLVTFLQIMVRHADTLGGSRPVSRETALAEILAVPRENARP